MNRRHLIVAGAASVLAAAAPRLAARAPKAKASDRLAITTVSLRDRYPMRLPGAPAPAGVPLTDAPAYVAKELGLRKVELWNLQFESDTPEYCQQLRKAADASKTSIINIQIDDRGDLASADAGVRARSVGDIKKWMDRAAILGARSVRSNFGFVASPSFSIDTCADSFRQLAEYGKSIDVRILCENHIGPSLDVANVVGVLKKVDHPYCRAIADWGNGPWKNAEQLLEGLRPLAPWLYLVSAKGKTFDADYRVTDYDVAAVVKGMEAWGFKGLYSIELYGATPPGFDPIRAAASVRDTILANIATGKRG